ncbi:MAG: hypothetical protein WCD56_14030, partial [Pseudolabrys sp.]
ADICSALADVRYVPKADMPIIRLPPSVSSFNNAAPLAARSDERAVHISAHGDKSYALGVVRC